MTQKEIDATDSIIRSWGVILSPDSKECAIFKNGSWYYFPTGTKEQVEIPRNSIAGLIYYDLESKIFRAYLNPKGWGLYDFNDW